MGTLSNEQFTAAQNAKIYEIHYNKLIEQKAKRQDEIATIQARIYDKMRCVFLFLRRIDYWWSRSREYSNLKPVAAIQVEETPDHYFEERYNPDD